jgi:hypothetical protein
MRQDAVDGDGVGALYTRPMHHKHRRPKARRADCLLWKPGKLNAHKTADRVRAREAWRRDWGVREDRNPEPDVLSSRT